MPMFAWALVFMVASYVIQSFTMKVQNQKPAGLDEWDFPQIEEGTEQTVVFGDVWLKGAFVLWYGDYETIKIKKGGKK